MYFFFLVVPILLCLYLRKHCMEEGRALIFSVFFNFFFISMILSWQLQNFKNKRNYNFQKVIVTLFLRIFALFFKVCFTLMEHKKEVTKKLFLTCFLYCFVFFIFHIRNFKPKNVLKVKNFIYLCGKLMYDYLFNIDTIC